MVFNSETNGLDLYSDARYMCGLDETSDTTSYPIKAFTRNCNFALDKILSYILRADNIWQFDDSNQSGELFDVTTNLVSGTSKYALGATWLKIKRVRIKDSNGNWVTLIPVDRAELNDLQLTATSGDPRRYDLLGNYLYIYPAPNYASTAGLEVQFQRGSSYFAYTDTTKTPGFAPQFHRLVSMMAALDYCKLNELTGRVNQLTADIGFPPDLMNNQAGSGMVKELVDYYTSRDADQKVSLTTAKEDYGTMSLNQGSGVFPTSTNLNPRGW